MADEIRGLFALAITFIVFGGAMWLFIQWIGRRQEKELAEKRKSRLGPPDIEEIMQALEADTGQARESHLDAGRPVYMIDPENKKWLIKELPDGTKQRVTFDAHGVEYVLERSK